MAKVDNIKSAEVATAVVKIDKKIIVRCRYNELLDIKKIKPNPKNPNRHSADQVELLTKIIKAQGWRKPLVISRQSGLLVKGHGVLAAGKKMKLTVLPVEYQNYDSPAQEKADMVADNLAAQMSETSEDDLLQIFKDIKKDEPEFDLTILAAPDSLLKTFEDIDFLGETKPNSKKKKGKATPQELPIADGEHMIFSVTLPVKEHAYFTGILNKVRAEFGKRSVKDGLIKMAQIVEKVGKK